ncbi:MAG: hypothetical protein JXK07_10180 [Spirochaetes bacterium]|nr:hypothetical protein [Spirochaetota bacterium]MBN2771234.1 hypothetical protein [Spirochaetota bacterium]
MKSILITTTACIITFSIGVGSGIFYMKHSKKDRIIPEKTIQTRQISGEKIRIKPISTTGTTFTFQTEAEGAGVSETKIDKRIIPEAASWMDKTNGLQLQSGFINVNQNWEALFEISYWKRWNTISFGGGVGFSKTTYSLKIGLHYSF